MILLQQLFYKRRVESALKKMSPLKSSGPDDFNPSFYQTYWHIVGDEVTSSVLKFLNDDIFDSGINFTYIVFIPKIKNSIKTFDFRPISLCNAIYKLVSKVLANRLKKILPTIISKSHSSFLPRRLILDNIIVAYEELHSMKTRQKGRNGSMAIKLDISKIYDKLEWNFLETMMRKLNFHER